MTVIDEPTEFWMVWTKTGHKPRFTHATAEAADTEARRLAALYPGKKFIVLRATHKIHAPVAVAEAA